mmetsp:Transcript_52387/g.168780  ORF Transcript_52387/g.168780 Transcript_52387/m.168780 type:complete len:203 (-) Transcript_52387:21-629(-)
MLGTGHSLQESQGEKTRERDLPPAVRWCPPDWAGARCSRVARRHRVEPHGHQRVAPQRAVRPGSNRSRPNLEDGQLALGPVRVRSALCAAGRLGRRIADQASGRSVGNGGRADAPPEVKGDSRLSGGDRVCGAAVRGGPWRHLHQCESHRWRAEDGQRCAPHRWRPAFAEPELERSAHNFAAVGVERGERRLRPRLRLHGRC